MAKINDQEVEPKEICLFCKFFATDNIGGYKAPVCRRNPPVIPSDPKRNQRYPITYPEDYCGEFECAYCGGGAIYNGHGVKIPCPTCGQLGKGE
jgi:hypothetical protein